MNLHTNGAGKGALNGDTGFTGEDDLPVFFMETPLWLFTRVCPICLGDCQKFDRGRNHILHELGLGEDWIYPTHECERDGVKGVVFRPCYTRAYTPFTCPFCQEVF